MRSRGFSADVLHVQCVSCNAAYALVAMLELGLPLVVTLQGELTMDASQLFQREAWAKRVMRESLKEADAITACSRQTLEEAETWFGTPFGDRGRVIHNGIAAGDLAEGVEPFCHPRPYLFAIGRHVARRGSICCCGLGLSGRVVFLGRIDHAMAMRLFTGCSFFVLPSRHEPFGIVNLEAMAEGEALIATRVGGVPEIVTEEDNGLLIEPEDATLLAKAIKRLAVDQLLTARLGRSGPESGGVYVVGHCWSVCGGVPVLDR